MRTRKKISQVFVNVEISHKLLTDQNYRSLIRVSRFDCCKFVLEERSEVPELAAIRNDVIKLFGNLNAVKCPIQVKVNDIKFE